MKALAIERKAATDTATPIARPVPATSRPVSIQRSADATSNLPSADASRLVERAVAGTSSRLDPAAQHFMEPRFGYDFSQVRVHADASSEAAARGLNARAFTIRDHVFFGAGQYAPTSGGGRHLLAHELAHVMQQRSGEVGGAQDAGGGFRLSDPGDRFERAAEASAAEALARPGAGPSTHRSPISGGAPSAARPGTIQRFLAGEAGHGGIEEDALHEAGFSKAEAHETYFGNWLRDFSQMPSSEAPSEAWLEFIKVLATGEFGRAPTNEELGRYLASEHVDRPEGGDSAENPDIGSQRRAKRRGMLSEGQRRWFDDEQTADFKKKMVGASAASGLPVYIERAKEHAKRQIAEAARLGRNEAGEHALGNGLHAVEDYFAHSNFIEVALTQLVADHAVAADNPSVHAMGGYFKVDPTNIGRDVKNRPQIVTGTSAPGPSQSVGLMEVMKAELKNTEIREAFLRGATIRYGWNAPRAGGRAALGAVGGVVGGGLGAVGGSVGGLVTGAGKGAAAGWRGAHHWWSKPFAAIGGLVSGAVSGAGRGAKAGAKAGWRVGERVGGAVGDVVGGAVGVALAPAVFAVIFPLYVLAGAAGAIAGPATEGSVNRRIQNKTRQTVDPSGKLNPTHSQIAKDDIDHPLHAAAARLAHDADVKIGQVMIEVWAGRRPVSDAQKLVDDYMAHPAANDWWKATLTKAVSVRAEPK